MKLNEQIKEHYNQKHRLPAISNGNNGTVQNIGTVDYSTSTNTAVDVRHPNNNRNPRIDYHVQQKESKAADNCIGMNDGGGAVMQSDERDSILASESNYRSMQQPYCNGNKDAFSYKTLSGGVIRSVHPPGKGSVVNYKVL